MRKGFGDIVQLLVNANAAMNAKSPHSANLTPLHLAVIHGRTEVVDILINAGADLNARGRYWETPLLLAALLGRLDAVRILLRANVDLTSTTEGGETAIMLGVISPNAVPMVQALLNAGCDVNARDAQGRTAVHYALDLYSFSTCHQILECLLDAGANLDIHCTVTGDTPLHSAACTDLQRRQYELNLQTMVSRFSTELVNEVHALRYALWITLTPRDDEVQGAEELAQIVKLLLEKGADSNAKNFDGDTPLQCVIKFRNFAPAVMLLCGRVDFMMNRLGVQAYLEQLSRKLRDEIGNI